MAFNTETSRLSQRNKPGAFGPPATFAAVVLLAIAGLGLSVATLPKDIALAAVSSLFFAFAALVALVAWLLDQPEERTLSYWDVAGALTLLGICAATFMDSDQLLRLIYSQRAAE